MEFKVDDRVRYRPGNGTYGYEDVLETDGRVPAVVIGFTKSRVRLKYLFGRLAGRTRGVDARSLILEA